MGLGLEQVLVLFFECLDFSIQEEGFGVEIGSFNFNVLVAFLFFDQ